jgi:hypothetical protein
LCKEVITFFEPLDQDQMNHTNDFSNNTVRCERTTKNISSIVYPEKNISSKIGKFGALKLVLGIGEKKKI